MEVSLALNVTLVTDFQMAAVTFKLYVNIRNLYLPLCRHVHVRITYHMHHVHIETHSNEIFYIFSTDFKFKFLNMKVHFETVL